MSSDCHKAPKSWYTCLIHRVVENKFSLTSNDHDPYFLHYSPLDFFEIYSKNFKNRQNTLSKMLKVSIAPPPPNRLKNDEECKDKFNEDFIKILIPC